MDDFVTVGAFTLPLVKLKDCTTTDEPYGHIGLKIHKWRANEMRPADLSRNSPDAIRKTPVFANGQKQITYEKCYDIDSFLQRNARREFFETLTKS
jgi:hypothetical protein